MGIEYKPEEKCTQWKICPDQNYSKNMIKNYNWHLRKTNRIKAQISKWKKKQLSKRNNKNIGEKLNMFK